MLHHFRYISRKNSSGKIGIKAGNVSDINKNYRQFLSFDVSYINLAHTAGDIRSKATETTPFGFSAQMKHKLYAI